MLKDLFSFWLPIILVPLYLYSMYTKFYELANPLTGLDLEALKHTGIVSPLWKEGEKFKLLAFLSHKDRFTSYRVSNLRNDNLLLIEKNGLEFRYSENEIKINLNILRPSSSVADMKGINLICDSLLLTCIIYIHIFYKINYMVIYSAPNADTLDVIASSKVWENIHKISKQPTVYLHIQIIRNKAIDMV